MSKVIFPKNWLLHIKDFDQLALKLFIPTNYLLDWDSKIPFYYHKKTITTKGRERDLLIPDVDLRNIQRRILDNILNFDFPSYVHGGVSDRSIITNAKTHLSQKWVMCLDIKDFFPSIHFKRIYNNFISLGCSPQIATLLTHFTTYKHQLPQGAPTSPAIANMVLYGLDKRLFNLCKIKRLKYSRYFDDITISGSSNPKSLIKKCESIINQEGFKINKTPEKLRIMPFTTEQLVTGLLVNGPELQPSLKEIKKIQDILDRILLGDFSIFIDKEPFKIKEMADGHIAFLKSINSLIAKKLEQKFNKVNRDFFCS
jgi:retron-type reverse transcriptase